MGIEDKLSALIPFRALCGKTLQKGFVMHLYACGHQLRQRIHKLDNPAARPIQGHGQVLALA
jgi:hypothetical protein